MKAIILVVALLLGTNLVRAQKYLKIRTIELGHPRQLEALQRMDFDIAGVQRRKGAPTLVDIVVNKKEQTRLLSLGYHFYVSPMRSRSGGGKKTKYTNKSGLDTRFKNPVEIEKILKKVNANYPSITKLVKIGKSLEGRAIWALRVTDNPYKDEVGEPSVLFNSMHHAREIITPEVSLDIIEQLVTGYGKSDQITKWVNNIDIWVVPMLNVDGNTKVWAGKTLWRKNTRDGHGVDLNRNYPSDWGTCNGSSGSKWSDTYRGHAPGSEPETKVLMNLVSHIRPVFDISYHAYSNMVIYPMGCEGKRVADVKLIEGIGNTLGKLLNYSAGTGWDLLYSTDGGDIDWMYERWGVIPFVLELTSRSTGFHPPYSARQPTVERNRVGWQYLLNRLFKSAVDLRVSGHTGVVKVKVIDPKTNKILSNYELKRDGTLRFVVVPGIYKVTLTNGNQKKSSLVTVKKGVVPFKVQF